jgi:very-short-patch-repair endonuclease
MAGETQRISMRNVLALAGTQHGVVTRKQLLEMGVSEKAIEHRLRRGRLHAVHRGVYAVGRPQLTRLGTLMAAVLSCGPSAALSHEQAGEVYGIRRRRVGQVEVTVPHALRKRHGVHLHRRGLRADELTTWHGIPLTTPVRTLVDLAARLSRGELEAAVNEADRLGLVDPEGLREALAGMAGRRGVATLRTLLDRRTFTLSDSELERRFRPLAKRAGLPAPQTQRRVNGFRVDFYWPDLGLVVETDGLRYHRTPAQQTRDRLRDQAHAAAGLTPLRFTHEQIAFDPAHVETTLAAVASGLAPKKLGLPETWVAPL